MSSETYLYPLKRTFYFRRRVPLDLLPFFQKAEIRKPLKTHNLSLAKKLAGHWDDHAESVFSLEPAPQSY